ncbi:MAG TPA: urate hydroxylase PuuD [Cellvibrio sp.]|nr:urate hydroxylase PuuD [Cellvibrio sp.]
MYKLLLRTPLAQRGLSIAVALLLVITAASYLAHQLFSPRAAYLHVGAMIATWMAGNVFWGIMPAQRKFIAAVSNNQAPDTNAIAPIAMPPHHHNRVLLLLRRVWLLTPLLICARRKSVPCLRSTPIICRSAIFTS